MELTNLNVWTKMYGESPLVMALMFRMWRCLYFVLIIDICRHSPFQSPATLDFLPYPNVHLFKLFVHTHKNKGSGDLNNNATSGKPSFKTVPEAQRTEGIGSKTHIFYSTELPHCLGMQFPAVSPYKGWIFDWSLLRTML